MNIFRATAMALLLCSGTLPFEAQATLGLFEHGAGIKSLGFGGLSYIAIEETTALSANPSAAVGLGSRFDIGSDILLIKSATRLSSNAAGPDASYSSNGRHVFPIPQAGVTVALPDHWVVGLAAFSAGFGPDYEDSPYARFAAPGETPSGASLMNSLKIVGLSLVSAREIIPGQSIGLAVNLQHESLTLRGATPFQALSESPDNVTDVGKHGALGIGFTVGWTGRISPWVKGALSYRSKSWTQRIEEYRGLLPDHGRLELPAIYGGGLQFTPAPAWLIATEYQRFAYSDVHAFGNPVDLAFQGRPLGSGNGPGFGWNDQNVFKIGVRYAASSRLTLRAGFLYATQIVPRSQTLLTPLAPATSQLHYTGGASFAITRRSEISSYAALAQKTTVRGRGSIPDALGGGEVDVGFRGISFGLTYGRRFGRSGP